MEKRIASGWGMGPGRNALEVGQQLIVVRRRVLRRVNPSEVRILAKRNSTFVSGVTRPVTFSNLKRVQK